MQNKLLEDMKELIKCYEYCQSQNPSSIEVNFWRKRYLKELESTLGEIPEYTKRLFLIITSQEMNEKSPFIVYSECEKANHEYESKKR